jgi:hypothetical protein
LREETCTKLRREAVADGEFRIDAAGSPPLVEARHHAIGMALRAHLFQKRDERGDHRGFARLDHFFRQRQGTGTHVRLLLFLQLHPERSSIQSQVDAPARCD